MSPKGVYERTPENRPKPRAYPEHIVESVRRMYLDEGMTVAEVQAALPQGFKAQRIIERHIPERRPAIKRDQRGERNDSWKGDDASYQAAHLRMGKVSESTCADCPSVAQHWSYQGGCPAERGGVDSPLYCTHPEHYAPRCVRCHHHYDHKGRRPNGQFVSRQEVMSYV